MPENPNIDPDTGYDGFYGTNITMATTQSNNNNNRKPGSGAPRVSSAGLKYYDIATQLLGKNGSDLEELFIAAARDGVYEKIENFLQRNRTEYFVCVDVKDKKTGNTPLIWAAKRGHAKIVQLLLRHGADITLRNYEGQTAVEVASPSIRAILLESVERSTEASHQLLLQAAWQGDIKVVSRLISQKKVLDINCQNGDGFTPIMLATRDMHLFEKLGPQMSRSYNPVEVVSELLSARADLHAPDGDGKTCLHHAASSKASIASSVVSTIIAGEPNLEQKDKRCFAPLHCASLTGNAECISTLLDGGSEVNSRGFAGATALHITSYNNHEKATNVLLEHGANVTTMDDRGLTPLDFAKTRKMRKKLQEAWTEATTLSKSSTSLGPIRAHSREDLRSSIEDLTKRKKGEVIFEGLPSNPFSDNKKDIANAKGLTRHLSLKEKNGKDEDHAQSHFRDVRKLGQVRSQGKPTPLPRQKSRSTERLPMISPDRLGSDRNRESPVMFARNTRARKSFEDRQRRGKRVPLSTREGSNVSGEESMGCDRLTPGPPSPTPSGVHHRRSDSDPNRGTPNLMDIAASCDPYLRDQRRGRSYSVTSNLSNHDAPCHHGDALQRECTLMSVCSVRTDSRMSNNPSSPRLLNLGQMLVKSKTPTQHLYGPGSSKVIPPSPAFITQRCMVNLDGKSDMDISPRSDEDLETAPEFYRSKSIYKDEFVLAESRPKDLLILSSGTDTVSSSGSSSQLSSASPRDSPMLKGRPLRTGKTNGVAENIGNRNTNQNQQMTVTGVKTNQKANATVANNANVAKSSAASALKQTPNQGPKISVSGKNSGRVRTETTVNAKSDKSVNNNKVAGSASSITDGHSMVVQNTATSGSKKNGLQNSGAKKSGGTIQVHGSMDVIGTSSGANADDKNNNNATKKETVTGNVQSSNNAVNSEINVQKGGKSGNVKSGSDPKGVTALKTDTKAVPMAVKSDIKVVPQAVKSDTKPASQTGATSAKQKAQKQMKSALQVVPTKLTENILRTAPKGSKEDVSGTKTVSSNKSARKPVPSNAAQSEATCMSNVNIQLTQSAHVVNRVAPQGNTSNNATSNAKGDVKYTADSKSDTAASASNKLNDSKNNNQSNAQKNVDNNTKLTEHASNINAQAKSQTSTTSNEKSTVPVNNNQTANKTAVQAQSAQNKNHQGVQSRNASFNVSKSATPSSQRQIANVRKTNSGYTPRFSPGLSSKPSSSQSSKSQSDSKLDQIGAPLKTDTNVSSSTTKPSAISTVAVQAKTNDTAQSKAVEPGSPTELVPPSVCRSASILKSYNMSAQPIMKAPTSNTTSSSETATTGRPKPSVSVKSETTKTTTHSVVSKSISDPLQNSVGSGKVANSSMVSKSISQMPSVGTIANNDKSPSAKSLLRSSSMSTIDEHKEKKLMSSSDTKIHAAAAAAGVKPRPSSDDGPGGAKNSQEQKDGTNNGAKPLMEIVPDGVPRISRRNYVDMNNPHTTPVIVNPFEELEQKREKENMERMDGRALTATEFGYVVEKGMTLERSKTQGSMKKSSQKGAKKAVTAKPTSAQSRGSSAKKKRSRSKEPSGNKSDNENSRPKSGKSSKRVRSAKRKRKLPVRNVDLAKENEKSDVALISGIGWQIATSCIDKTDADAIVVSQIDSSESESEICDDISEVQPLRLNLPNDTHLHIPNAIETPTSASPRFREVRPSFGENPKEKLPQMDNDGYRPMNLDLTQKSNGSQNRSGVLIGQEMPEDITDFFSRLGEGPNDVFTDDDEYDDYDDENGAYEGYGDENMENAIQRGVMMGHLTPIPESPSLTNTLSTTPQKMCVTKTVEVALQKFDKNVRDEDLNMLLGSTPRDKNSLSSSDKGSAHSNRANPARSVSSGQSQKDSKSSTSSSKGQNSRVSSSKTHTSNISTEIRARAKKVLSNSMPLPNTHSGEVRERSNTSNRSSGGSLRKSSSSEKLNASGQFDGSKSLSKKGDKVNKSSKPEDASSSTNNETKERIDNKILDLKKLLADKMESTQKLLEESSQNGPKRKTGATSSENATDPAMKLSLKELTADNLKTLETARAEDDSKSSRSSRKERRFSETKNDSRDEEINEAIDEIMSNTFPSSRSTLRSTNSLRSASNTLTEADRQLLIKMAQEKQASPFHAKGGVSVNISSSFDEAATLHKDNPELLKNFNPESGQFKMGQRVQAMLDAGAEKTKVKAMIKADTEAKQIAKIMNSFKQMELYAGSSNNRSTRKETPRKEGEHMFKSMSRFDQASVMHGGMPPRPGSAGAGRMKPGRFTEIKGGKSATVEKRDRAHSPSNVPRDLAEEFKRSPFRRVSSHESSENFEELANVIRPGSPDSDEDHISLEDSDHERADSACTMSSQSSLVEDTIQWKKGNVLGKGAFGTVWCGLTSEGQLIAVKQIELNTTNQNKAKKEYEKVQEEVELLKTLEHKNIVGYLGTSLEDSIVSIFMQFVPGGSIASILARFGALDEAVFRKYTRQILEGVEYLHQNDVIHRDIKGGNVMLMPNGVIKLIDFGCAKRLCINLSMGQSQILKSMKGTPYWMAPEVVNETGHGKKSDIWSVGCTVFEMATRKPPWADMNPMAAIFAIGSDKPVPDLPEKFSEEARDFVNACLTKDQSKRLSATELLSTSFLKRRIKKNSSNC